MWCAQNSLSIQNSIFLNGRHIFPNSLKKMLKFEEIKHLNYHYTKNEVFHHGFLLSSSHLLKKSLIKNFIFCAVNYVKLKM